MEPNWSTLTASLPFELAQWPLLLILGGLLLMTLLFLRFGARLPQGGASLAVVAIGGFTLLSLLLVWQNDFLHLRTTWFEVAPAWFDRLPLHLSVGLRTDGLANLMALLVLFIGTLVHLFSQVYLKDEPFLHRYWGYLSFFTLAMLLIVWADNLLLIYVAWELVGLSSYLLIGFWFKNPQPARASQKAFLINRIGDLGFLMGMMILIAQAGTLDLGALESLAQSWSVENGRWLVSVSLENGESLSHELSAGWLTAAGLLIFGGCIGKSAQFPLQVWLPDAMAGPTPVSALIHAATMVAAGIYLMARVFFLLNAAA
ncbi:MAG: proton-conducting transporter membrane subunit, partial [Bacteroidota bacterium]